MENSGADGIELEAEAIAAIDALLAGLQGRLIAPADPAPQWDWCEARPRATRHAGFIDLAQ